MNTRKVILVALCLPLCYATPLNALTITSHRAMIEKLADLMKQVEDEEISTDPAPPGEEDTWEIYIDQVKGARESLSELQCGLPMP